MRAEDITGIVTDRIIAELEKGVSPFVRPWGTHATSEWAINPTTRRLYSGFNAMWLTMQSSEFTCNRWVTFKQAQAEGGTVRRGEKATPAIRPLEITRGFNDAASGEEVAETMLLFRGFALFNLDQCDNLDHLRPAVNILPADPIERIPEIEEIITNTGAHIHVGGNQCFYSPAGDFIQMVHPNQFADQMGYYATIFHELTHWTGAKHRLERDMSGDMRSNEYGFEELVAELGSSFCCQRVGIDGIERHSATYIGAWLKILREDNKAILKASAAARRAYEYLLPPPAAPGP